MAEHFSELAADIAAELDIEFESNLISAVKSFRCLYAKDDPNYHNMQQNKIAWLKVSHSLRKTVTECMNRWYYLLKTFLIHSRIESKNGISSNWTHYESLREMQSYISDCYSELSPSDQPHSELKPTLFQRDMLFVELTMNRAELISLKTSSERKQQIWAQIADKLNQIPDGVQMPIVRWQKYWWDLKQSVGEQRSRIRMKLQAMGTKIDVAKYSEEDLKILKFCGISGGESKWTISAALGNNYEFGSDKDKIVRKCKKCTIFLNDLLTNDFCETCAKIPRTLCDICSEPQAQALVTHNVANWSVQAKLLLPQSFYSYAELSICITCCSDLKKKASQAWKACRVCECYKQNLESIFSSANDNLRKVFHDATNIIFGHNDGLPNYICKVCKVQMQQFNNFYLKFLRVQNRLLDVHREKFMGTPLMSNKTECSPQNKQIIKKVMLLNPGQDANKNCVPGQVSNGSVTNVQPVCTSTGPNRQIIYMRKKIPREGENPQVISNTVITGISPGNGSRIVVSGSPTNSSPGTIKRSYLIPKGTSIRPKADVTPTFTNSRLTTASAGPKIVSATSLANKPIKRQMAMGSLAPPIPLKTNVAMPQDQMPMRLPSAITKKLATYNLPREPIRATPPAVFRIPGELFDCTDSPPIFCIPKTNALPRNSPTIMPQSLKTTAKGLESGNPSNDLSTDKNCSETMIIERAIKSEKIGDDDALQDPLKKTEALELNVAKQQLTVHKTDSDMSSTSSRFSVDSHNSISKEPVAKEMKLIRLDGTTVVLRSNPAGGGFMPFPPDEGSFQDVFMSSSTKPLLSKPLKDKSKKNTSPTLLQKATSQQNPATDIHDRQQQLTGTKKLRKYWGTVDEFQISFISDKSVSNAESIQQPISSENGLHCMPATTAPSISGVSLDLILKKEQPDKDDDCLAVDDQPGSSNTNPSMFYPDSFELDNVAMDVDVSSMLEDMMTKPNTIAGRDAESFKYINPSFLKSYALHEDPSKNKSTENKPNGVKSPARFPTKKLRVKLKRYRIRKLDGKINSSTKETLTTRKSLRKSKGCLQGKTGEKV